MKKILVTGATGQLGSELTITLRNRYGAENVLAADKKPALNEPGPLIAVWMCAICRHSIKS